MMRDALLRDFAEIESLQITLTYDVRLPKPNNIDCAVAINAHEDVWRIWESFMQQADAVLLVAPETAGQLMRLTLMAERLNKLVLGCHSSAVKVTSDKYQTFKQLQKNGISTISTYLFSDLPEHKLGAWVAKPIDGAGCADSRLFEDQKKLIAWMRGRENTHIIQPLQQGIAASFTMLCKGDAAHVLTCNRQKVVIEEGVIEYQGGIVNALSSYQLAFERVAQQIIEAIPGLKGYVGVDLVVDNENIYVVEINPRLTTSYVGLRQASGVNPARMLLDLFYNESFKFPSITYHAIDISLDAAT